MKARLLACFLAASAPAYGQASGPYKLVVTYYQTIVVTDYPSLARCEAAAKVVNQRMMAKATAAGLPAASGEVAFCIPG